MQLRAVCLLACAVWVSPRANAESLWEPSTGIRISVSAKGEYRIEGPDPTRFFAGSTGRSASAIRINAGVDTLGDYREISFRYTADGPRDISIRTFADRPVVLLKCRYLSAQRNSEPFPRFSSFPSDVPRLSFAGMFALYKFNYLSPDSPWFFIGADGSTTVISPADNFPVASMTLSATQEIVTGVMSSIATLPQDYTTSTLLVFEPGISKAFDTWGTTLTRMYQKVRPANDADPVLKSLGYWTDAGATYYYNFEQDLGYEQTLLQIRDEFNRLGIPLGYLQLDSWFYPKGSSWDWRNRAGGIQQYVAEPTLFPNGLKAFQQKLGAPLITHARWVDTTSPYRLQYSTSGNVVVDADYWSNIAQYLRDSGGTAYEQDWLGAQAQPAYNLSDPEAFLNNMANAAAANGLSLQYCMALPRHFLQGAKYSNLTTIRVSEDRFERDRWDQFLYGSRFANSLGIWPWTDVFMSNETENLLLATLSAGPVGVGDSLGELNRTNLLRAARQDGVIVKPDLPAAPTDSVMLQESQGNSGPMVASTYTDFGAQRVSYWFAYARSAGPKVAVLDPTALGYRGPVYAYDYFAGTGHLLESDSTMEFALGDGIRFAVIAPVGKSGMALLGDKGQFVMAGRKRIEQLSDDGILRTTVRFAATESSRILTGYAPFRLAAVAESGAVQLLSHDPKSGLFEIAVTPGSEGVAVVKLQRRGIKRVAPVD